MKPAAVQTLGKVDLQDAVVVVAFPTTGSAAPIAGHYLVRHLHLPLVGHVPSGDGAAVMAVTEGIGTSAIRIHGGEVACRLDKGCPRAYIVVTELPVPPQMQAGIAAAVLEWAAQGGAHMVLVLEAVVRGEGDTTPDVYCASAEASALRELRKSGIPSMERALIGGMTAHLLMQAPARKVRAGALVVEATREHPDGRAAAALCEAFGRIAPDIKLDARPLLKEAMELEQEIRRAQRDVAPPPAAAGPSFI